MVAKWQQDGRLRWEWWGPPQREAPTFKHLNWSRRSGLNGRPAVYEDHNQAIAPKPNPRPNPVNRMIRQWDSPHKRLHLIAWRVRGLRGKGYTNGYTDGDTTSPLRPPMGVGVGKFPRGYPRIRAHPLKYTQKKKKKSSNPRVTRPTCHPPPSKYHELRRTCCVSGGS